VSRSILYTTTTSAFDPPMSAQALQSWPLQHAPRVATIVIMSRQGHPAFVLLTQDKGLASFTLRIERVEILLQALLS
jgi:hypothetical protein